MESAAWQGHSAVHFASWCAVQRAAAVTSTQHSRRPPAAAVTVPDEERAYIRERLVPLLVDESEESVARVSAELCATIARRDWPTSWPGLFRELMAHVQPANAQHCTRALGLLHRVVKTLSRMPLLLHRKRFDALSAELLPALLPTAQSLMDRTLAAAAGGAAEGVAYAAAARPAVKAVCVLLSRSLHAVAASDAVQTFLASGAPRAISQLLALRDRLRAAAPGAQAGALEEECEKMLKALGRCDPLLAGPLTPDH